MLFTADTLHGQKTFRRAAATSNALLIRVKGNPPGLRDALIRLCAEPASIDRILREDASRIRTRPGLFAPLRSFALSLDHLLAYAVT